MECVICGGSARLVYKGYPGFKKPQEYDIYNCRVCNTSFPSTAVVPEEIYENIYDNGKDVIEYEQYYKYAQEIKGENNPLDYLGESNPVYFAVRDSLKKVPYGSDILEVGCGMGYLTYALNKTGYNAKGIDISRTAIERAIASYGKHYEAKDVHDYCKMASGKYDVVISTEVIEHIPNPIDFIKDLLKLCKPKGYVLITTPNKTFYPNKMVWESTSPPVHLWWFSEKSIMYIAKAVNGSARFTSFREYFMNPSNILFMTKKGCVERVNSPVLNSDGNVVRLASRRIINDEGSLTLSFKEIHTEGKGMWPESIVV